MNNKISVLLCLSLLLGTPVYAVNPIIPHSVTPVITNLQKIPIDIGLNSQHLMINNTANLKTINSYNRWVRNGTASLQKLTDVSGYIDLYTTQFDDYITDKSNTFLDNATGQLSSATGWNAPNISADMLADPNRLQQVAISSAKQQGTNIANSNLKEIQDTAEILTGLDSPNLTVDSVLNPDKLANDALLVADRKTSETLDELADTVIQYAVDKIKKAMDKKESDKKPKELDQIGITGDTLKTPSDNTALGADGNRSDTFGGTGNGSTAQAEKSKKTFEKVNKNIAEGMQHPADFEKAQKMTPAQLERITHLQNETVKEMASKGLAKAWIRQAVITGQLEQQEETFTDLFNQNATDIRKVLQLLSFVSLATVESQNNTSAILAANLSIMAAKTIHEGITLTPYVSASSNQEK